MITGSRRGEVSALWWRHVDSDRAILWVHRSNAQTKAGITRRKPRPGNAERSHSIPTRSGCSTTIGSCGSSAAPPRLWCGSRRIRVLPRPDGSAPHAPRAISQRYRRMAIKLTLRSTRLHSLRPLLGNRTGRRWRRSPHRCRATRTRQRRRDHPQGVRSRGR